MKKRLLCLLLILLTLSLLAACGPRGGKDREAAARQFLETMLADDAELQGAVLSSYTFIGEGVAPPTEEELAAREERAAQVPDLIEQRFGGLLSPELIAEESEFKGDLAFYQVLLAVTGSSVTVEECRFTEGEARLHYDGLATCVNGDQEQKLPLRGTLTFNENDLIIDYDFDDGENIKSWLSLQHMTMPDYLLGGS